MRKPTYLRYRRLLNISKEILRLKIRWLIEQGSAVRFIHRSKIKKPK